MKITMTETIENAIQDYYNEETSKQNNFDKLAKHIKHFLTACHSGETILYKKPYYCATCQNERRCGVLNPYLCPVKGRCTSTSKSNNSMERCSECEHSLICDNYKEVKA